jgi:hypothetical protein
MKPSDGDDSDYPVGYRKPPKHTRFRPGRSGNPKGRPKGTKNLKTDLVEELAEKIRVREGDKTQHVSKQRAMLKALMAKGLKGDVRAVAQLVAMMGRLMDLGETSPDDGPTTLADLVRRATQYEKEKEREASGDETDDAS